MQGTRAPAVTSGALDTGLAELDAVAGPLESGRLLFVASPPCSGKTTLALTIAKHACERHGREVLYWGPHADQDRRLAAACRTLSAVRRGSFRMRCMNSPLAFRDARDAPGLLIIDAIPDHPVWLDNRPVSEGADGAREICKALRCFSFRFRCPIVVVTELARLAQEPRHTPPALADLGLLRKAAQRSGRVVLMHRPSLYEPDIVGLGARVAVLESPRQCSDPAGPTCVELVHDAGSGLYRCLTDAEHREAWA